jgi:TRAP-type mannitol/chloroaromatic compound transport system permease large subunit
MAVADYPDPVIVASVTGGTTGLQPAILDVSQFITPDLPPVIQIYISNTATVVITASGKLSTTDPPTLLYAAQFGNSVTTSDFVDLIGGARMFYQFNVTANTGTVVIMALAGSNRPGTLAMPQLVRMTTNATSGL